MQVFFSLEIWIYYGLFKKGTPELPTNHRPGSLLSNIGKLMERVIFKHVCNFLYANDLIYKNQSGVLSGPSTVYQLLDIYHQICQVLILNNIHV